MEGCVKCAGADAGLEPFERYNACNSSEYVILRWALYILGKEQIVVVYDDHRVKGT